LLNSSYVGVIILKNWSNSMRYAKKDMEREHRISAGAIVIRQDKILLVRYKNNSGDSYLVGPGGGVMNNEGLNQAVIREVREETGLEVAPRRILFVEDLVSSRYRLVKIWFLCDLIGGQLADTQDARKEGITEVGWYRRDQLHDEVVYPPPLLTHNWNTFFKDTWESIHLEIRNADFDF
jgi:8-oxo-dGTP diphosphatase